MGGVKTFYVLDPLHRPKISSVYRYDVNRNTAVVRKNQMTSQLLITIFLLIILCAYSEQQLLMYPFTDINETTIRTYSSRLYKHTLLSSRDETDIPKAINITEVAFKLSVYMCSQSNTAGIFLCEADIPNFHIAWVCLCVYFTILSL